MFFCFQNKLWVVRNSTCRQRFLDILLIWLNHAFKNIAFIFVTHDLTQKKWMPISFPLNQDISRSDSIFVINIGSLLPTVYILSHNTLFFNKILFFPQIQIPISQASLIQKKEPHIDSWFSYYDLNLPWLKSRDSWSISLTGQVYPSYDGRPDRWRFTQKVNFSSSF